MAIKNIKVTKGDKILNDYMTELLSETEPKKEEAPEYSKEDWDCWERELIREDQALIDECKDM